MAEVQERLEERFRDLDPTVVAAAIRLAAAGITGPVRDFVPLLVERAARERLMRVRAGGAAASDAEVARLRPGPQPASGAPVPPTGAPVETT